MARNTILFVAYGGGHAQSLIPVIKRLQQMQVKCVVLGASTGAISFRSAGVECLDFSDLIPHKLRGLVENYGARLLEENYNPHSGLTRNQSIAYLGLSYLNNVAREGQEQAARLYFSHGRQSFLPLDTMETLIEIIQPDSVVTSVSPRSELAARIEAKKKDIPIIAVADSVNPDLPSNPIIVDTLCVPSETAKKNWSEKNYVICNNIVVTGNPAYDKLSSVLPRDRTSILFCQQSCRFNATRRVWENLGEADMFEHFERWEEVARRISTPCDVRLHPTINKDVFFRWKSSGHKKLGLDAEPDTGTSLSRRKVVVGNFSTLLTEALYTRTPVLQYLYEGEVDTLDGFVKQGLVKSARFNDVDSISDSLLKLITGEDTFEREFWSFSFLYPRPPAAPRVVEQIIGL